MKVMAFLVSGVTGVPTRLQMAKLCQMHLLISVTLETLLKHFGDYKTSNHEHIFSHIHLMGGWRGLHMFLGGYTEILSCDKTLQNAK